MKIGQHLAKLCQLKSITTLCDAQCLFFLRHSLNVCQEQINSIQTVVLNGTAYSEQVEEQNQGSSRLIQVLVETSIKPV